MKHCTRFRLPARAYALTGAIAALAFVAGCLLGLLGGNVQGGGYYARMDAFDLYDLCRGSGDVVACIIIADELTELDRFAQVNTAK